MMKIAVLGAGVNGLACAIKIKEKYDFDVTLISSEFSPNTTGDGSGGLWYPYLCGDTPGHLLAKWGGETYKFLHELWLSGGHAVCLMPIYELYRQMRDLRRPQWADVTFGYQVFDQTQLDYFSGLYSSRYTAGQTFVTFIIPPESLLPLLYQRFSKAGGKIVKMKVNSLRDPVLEPFDIVVNCTGLGAKYIVPDDKVYPIRGQVHKVIAPWVNETMVDEDRGNYLIPNDQTCVLGGTHQEHDYNTAVDEKDTVFILKGCEQMILGLKYAKLVNDWAGLRPGRNQIRLESEERDGKFYIHNYGHGGSGLTLFWGCATEVLTLLEKHMDIKKSKI